MKREIRLWDAILQLKPGQQIHGGWNEYDSEEIFLTWFKGDDLPTITWSKDAWHKMDALVEIQPAREKPKPRIKLEEGLRQVLKCDEEEAHRIFRELVGLNGGWINE